jgi:hypothetical protein
MVVGKNLSSRINSELYCNMFLHLWSFRNDNSIIKEEVMYHIDDNIWEALSESISSAHNYFYGTRD